MSDVIELLVVDDEVDFLETISERLEQRGFSVTKATSGAEALEVAKKAKFDLALVDLRMPEMDGIELLQTLKSSHKYLEVLVLTGFGTIETAVEATKHGAFGYLSKSSSLEDLLKSVKEAYAHRLKKKFQDDEERYQAVVKTLSEQDPLTTWYEAREEMKYKPSLFSLLRKLRKVDDNEK